MIVLLVRHAWAGSREEWTGDDRLRPLDRRGLAQAEALVGVVAGTGASVRRILTSPYLRCRQSVEPLGAALDLRPEVAPELAEGTGEAALGLLRGLPAADAVLCSHGDILPMLLEHVATEDGVSLGRRLRCGKGSVWVLSGDSPARFTRALYLRAPR